MKKSLILLAFFAIIISCKSFAQETPHPIDVFLDSCLEKNISTMGMTQCTDEAVKMWDAELNKYYKILMSVLDDESVKSLKAAEVQWIIFKDSEFENIDMMYSKLDGTMYIPMHSYAKLEIIKARALQLKDYYELMTGNN
jgi:uncharacterized protein YecT (DUF1311 family)